MTTNPSPTVSREKNLFARHWGFFVVLAAVALVAFVRMRLLDLPLERDEGEYAYAGQLLLQGIPPYELAYNMKFPGTYLAYALIMAVFGQTPIGIHLGVICITTLTAGLLYGFGQRFFDETTGAIAGSAYALLAASPAMSGLAGHATHFAALFATAGLCLAWPSDNLARPRLRALAAGVMFGLSLLMKQHAAVFCLWAIGMLSGILHHSNLSPPERTRRVIFLCLGTVLPFAITCLWLWHAGVFAKFWFWTIDYARHYAVQTPLRYVWYAFQYGFINRATHRTRVFWLLVPIALFLIWRDPQRRQHRLALISFFVAAFLSTVPGLIFRDHYFLLLLPAVAVVIGIATSSAGQLSTETGASPIMRRCPLIAYAVIAMWTIFAQRDVWFQMNTLQAANFIYPGNPFPQSAQIAEFITENSPTNSRVAVLGSEPQIYFLSNRRSATGYIYMYPLMESQPFATQMQAEMINEIETTKPNTIVFVSVKYSWTVRPESNRKVLDWWVYGYHTNYDVIGALPVTTGDQPGAVSVYRRKDLGATSQPSPLTPAATGETQSP